MSSSLGGLSAASRRASLRQGPDPKPATKVRIRSPLATQYSPVQLRTRNVNVFTTMIAITLASVAASLVALDVGHDAPELPTACHRLIKLDECNPCALIAAPVRLMRVPAAGAAVHLSVWRQAEPRRPPY